MRPPRALGAAMLAAGIATFALLYATQPLLPALADAFGVGGVEASLAVSLTTGPLAVMLLVAGILSDRLGRRGMMIASMLAAALLTCLSAAVASWPLLLASRLLVGIALAGVPSVALAYVAEEGDAAAISGVIGLYVAGTTLGGMAGRLGVSLVADRFGWQAGLGAVGAAGVLLALAFWGCAPRSRGFVRRDHDWRSLAAATRRLARDAVLPWLYAEACLLMGAFVTLYNFAGFHLRRPPFGLSQAAVGAVFLLYLVGTGSSAWFGRLAGRHGAARMFRVATMLFLGGTALTLAPGLPAFVIGLGLATGGFFGAHAIASSWVSRRAGADRAQAASFYLFFYYLGSSLLGSLGGVAWARFGWPGIATYAGALIAAGLAIASRLHARGDPAAA